MYIYIFEIIQKIIKKKKIAMKIGKTLLLSLMFLTTWANMEFGKCEALEDLCNL